jgi:hypothetical protein
MINYPQWFLFSHKLFTAINEEIFIIKLYLFLNNILISRKLNIYIKLNRTNSIIKKKFFNGRSRYEHVHVITMPKGSINCFKKEEKSKN